MKVLKYRSLKKSACCAARDLQPPPQFLPTMFDPPPRPPKWHFRRGSLPYLVDFTWVFRGIKMYFVPFRAVTPYSMLGACGRFGGTYRLRFRAPCSPATFVVTCQTARHFSLVPWHTKSSHVSPDIDPFTRCGPASNTCCFVAAGHCTTGQHRHEQGAGGDRRRGGDRSCLQSGHHRTRPRALRERHLPRGMSVVGRCSVCLP